MADPARRRPGRGLTVRAALALVLALTAAPLLPAAPPAVAASGPWAPDRAYLYLEGAPGAVLEDRLTVTNRSGEPLTLRLRAEAAGPWIALAARTVTVPARTRAEIPFTVTLPASTPPGGRTATITASGRGREEPVRLHLRVRGPLLAALTVEDVSYADGSIRYALVNRGNTPLTPRVALRADGLFGEVLSRPARVRAELPPGRRVTLSEPWSDPPHLDAVDIRVTAGAPGAARAEATVSRTFAAWPVTATLLTCAVTAAALVLRRRVPSRRRGRTVSERRPPGAGA
ncbi:hypothetical protein [Streptomyces sp. PKU-EA00015]|uniref:COG1470 family protein n=1 Tax=Streptomyces sp. PKU-EA00015 TaxID=2748326 RepID=UPI002810C1F7|nr:hypothetical protein [Streptomyces sp. PKU-EA00015]